MRPSTHPRHSCACWNVPKKTKRTPHPPLIPEGAYGDEDYRFVPCTKGVYAMVSLEDYE